MISAIKSLDVAVRQKHANMIELAGKLAIAKQQHDWQNVIHLAKEISFIHEDFRVLTFHLKDWQDVLPDVLLTVPYKNVNELFQFCIDVKK